MEQRASPSSAKVSRFHPCAPLVQLTSALLQMHYCCRPIRNQRVCCQMSHKQVDCSNRTDIGLIFTVICLEYSNIQSYTVSIVRIMLRYKLSCYHLIIHIAMTWNSFLNWRNGLEEWIVEIRHIHAAHTAFISRLGWIIFFSLKQLTILFFFPHTQKPAL